MKEDLRTIREALNEVNVTGDPFRLSEALSALTRIEEQLEREAPKVLTDEKARWLARHFVAIQKEGHGFTNLQIIEAALVYARDHGYLSPAPSDEANSIP